MPCSTDLFNVKYFFYFLDGAMLEILSKLLFFAQVLGKIVEFSYNNCWIASFCKFTVINIIFIFFTQNNLRMKIFIS